MHEEVEPARKANIGLVRWIYLLVDSSLVGADGCCSAGKWLVSNQSRSRAKHVSF